MAAQAEDRAWSQAVELQRRISEMHKQAAKWHAAAEAQLTLEGLRLMRADAQLESRWRASCVAPLSAESCRSLLFVTGLIVCISPTEFSIPCRVHVAHCIGTNSVLSR